MRSILSYFNLPTHQIFVHSTAIMKSTISQRLGFAAIFALGATSVVNACSVDNDITITFYGFPDNDPPGATTAYNCGGRNNIAGGVGTFDDPLTFASAPDEFSSCEVIYLPYLKKYLRFEDSCEQCTTDLNSGKQHVDVWTGSSTVDGGQTQIQCENSLTPDAQPILRQPPEDLPVDSTELFADGQCQTSHTYIDAPGSCT